MLFRLCVVLGTFALPAAAGTGVCVENGTGEAFLFAAEARGGLREVAMLDPGGRLCSARAGGAGGVVSVFESAEHEEGCSRLVAEGETETLLEYVDFDRCRWSSHDE
ncbi:MAG: hypothetical protein QNJ44_18670 [Rhodobacter sp.]|nr:hypothetical protein [Rhodobacter sp.]